MTSSDSSRRWCASCGARAAHRHHVVYRQHLRIHGGSARDERFLLDVCKRCHDRHHSRMEPLPLRVLRQVTFDAARELLGGPLAYVYLARRYSGGDRRHDALLELV